MILPLLVTAIASAAAAAPVQVGGVALGTPVARVVHARGNPVVVTTDVGHVWTWSANGGATTLRVTTDDDGIVRMIDYRPTGSKIASIAIPGRAPLFYSRATLADAQHALSGLADFEGATTFPDGGGAAHLAAFRLSPAQELILLFDDRTRVLTEAFYGEPPTLARAGLLPKLAATLPPFRAPVLEKLGGIDVPSGEEGVTYVRIEVGKDGSVVQSAVFISSGDPRLDRIALAAANEDRFTPATEDGSQVTAVFFYRDDFRMQRATRSP